MILERNQWYFGYRQILADCRASSDHASAGGTALILCNADVDSLAAARIWSYLLRSDGVSHQIQPCTAHSQLRRVIGRQQQQLAGSSDLRAVVLLNLGATRNLTKLFVWKPISVLYVAQPTSHFDRSHLSVHTCPRHLLPDSSVQQ